MTYLSQGFMLGVGHGLGILAVAAIVAVAFWRIIARKVLG